MTVKEAGFGVMLPNFDPLRLGTPPLLAAARLAEDLGFESGWVGDHLSFHPPILEPCGALAAVAAVTQRLVLGTGVLLLPMRNPVWTAKQLGTVAALAPDRLIVGVGVGGENPAEFEAAGYPVAQRGRRLDEAMVVVDALMRGEAVDHPGPLLPVHSPKLEPVPSSRPPLVVGGRSAHAVRRAARLAEGWFAVWLSPRRVRAAVEDLRAHAEEFRRPVCTTVMLVFAHITEGTETGRAELQRFVAGQYGMPVEAIEKWCVIGSEARVADVLAEYRDAGAESFVIMPTAANVLAQYERLAAVREQLATHV
ncbi:LLM class flavin-dependent oxidoreductase [Mycobacterium sp. 050272]|uniref:LLM class flavin-dependent oxidoreductase n=1 Tax=Mycobacterium sp. 050272 TaxID=3142488 RepID=UPI00319BA05C